MKSLIGKKLFLPMTLGLATLFTIALYFYYFEPVKLKRMERLARYWTKFIFDEKEQRQSSIEDYESIELQKNRTSDLQSSAGSHDVPIRLMDKEYKTNSSSIPHKISIMLDGQNRQAIMGIVPFGFSYRLRVPRDSYLLIGLNQEGLVTPNKSLVFTVRVLDETETKILFEDKLASNHTMWKDDKIDLTSFAGREVKISFNVSLDGNTILSADTAQAQIKAYWSNLFVNIRYESNPSPNIFLVLIDTLRADHLSCYGYERPTSPNIDKLSAEGVRFIKAFSSSPWTNPSILSLFTGLYPSDLWEPEPHKKVIRMSLPKEVDTLAEILSANGYYTIAASDHPGINAKLFGQGFDIYSKLYHGRPYYGLRKKTPVKEVLQKLHLLLKNQSNMRGLFAYIHLLYPHKPYDAPHPYDSFFGRGAFRVIQKNKTAVHNMYDGQIKQVDDLIGSFLKDMQKLRLDEDSIIIILSDHGEGFWEHGLYEHGNSLYNELLNIPLILHAPSRFPQGKIIDEVVSIVDILPTILDIVDIDFEDNNFRGTSLLPLIQGSQNCKQLAFSEFPHSRIVKGRAIQSMTKKLIDPKPEKHLLEYYDLTRDPKELKNLTDIEFEMFSGLNDVMGDISRSTTRSRATVHLEKKEPSKETLEKLKSLGYIN